MTLVNSGRFRIRVIGPLAVEDIQVNGVPERRPMPEWVVSEIDRLWVEEGGAGGKGLFDGRLAGLLNWHRDGKTLHMELVPVRYRELWYLHRRAGEQWVPSPEILPRALGVSAVLLQDEDLILMQRSSSVGEWPGKLDVFGGHIDWPEGRAVSTPSEATQRELNEELGDAGKLVVLCSCLGLAEVVRTQKPELVYLAHLPGDVLLSLADVNDEVQRLVRWPLTRFPDLLTKRKEALTPSAEASLWLFALSLQARGWWWQRPERSR